MKDTSIENVRSMQEFVAVRRDMTKNQSLINDIADALNVPPAMINASYANCCKRAASFLRNPIAGVMYSQNITSNKNSNNDDVIRNEALNARNNVFDMMYDVNSIAYRVKSNRGNPFVRVQQLNMTRMGSKELNIDASIADDIISSFNEHLDFLEKEFPDDVMSAAQLSSATLSFQGFGGTGNASVDLLKFVPNSNEVRKQKYLDIISSFNFAKRVPSIVFAQDYSPDGKRIGCILAWKKIPDASGYVITRRDVFNDTEKSFVVSNDELVGKYIAIRDYVVSWALSFYDSLDERNVFCFLDDSIEDDEYYLYSIKAYQTRKNSEQSMFKIDTSPVNMSEAQRIELVSLAKSLETNRKIRNPYTVISQYLFGRDDYDWILSAVNTRASIMRNDDIIDTRAYSFIEANIDHLFHVMGKGNFVIPKNINDIADSIGRNISTFGVSQIINEILLETGIAYSLDGQDAKSESTFENIFDKDPSDSGFIASIVSAIDPETVTLDIRNFTTNMSNFLANRSKNSTIGAKSSEISVPDGTTINEFGDILGNINGKYADLTTFDGIAYFVRAIGVFFDFGSNRHRIVETVVI